MYSSCTEYYISENMSDNVSDGINEEPQRADVTPQLDFCRRHYTKCVIVGATSMIVVTATVITCAVVVGYKISKETITFQYGTVVFKTTDNTSVIQRISVHGSGQKEVTLRGEAMIIFDYPHFLMMVHFSKFDGICFATPMNGSWTKIFKLQEGQQTVQTSNIPGYIWYVRTDALMDNSLVPASVKQACRQRSYWMSERESVRGLREKTHRSLDCRPVCLTFCVSPKAACIKVCLYNPCTNSTSPVRPNVYGITGSVNRTGGA